VVLGSERYVDEHDLGSLAVEFAGCHIATGAADSFPTIGATGVAQCGELVRQQRVEADKRQMSGARIGLPHNIGLGSAAAVAVYRARA
jgi:acetyl-CoA acetyltransferase